MLIVSVYIGRVLIDQRENVFRQNLIFHLAHIVAVVS